MYVLYVPNEKSNARMLGLLILITASRVFEIEFLNFINKHMMSL